MVDEGILDRIYSLMHTMTSSSFQKMYMFIISNLAADNKNIGDIILQNEDIVQELVTTANHSD